MVNRLENTELDGRLLDLLTERAKAAIALAHASKNSEMAVSARLDASDTSAFLQGLTLSERHVFALHTRQQSDLSS